MVAMELSLNKEISLMVPVMSLHQTTWTTVAREFPLKILRDFSLNVEVSLMRVMYPHQLMQIKVARDFSHNMEATLMVYGMSLNQLQSTMVARDFSLNIETSLMFHVMSLH